jgi:hypothetical protein
MLVDEISWKTIVVEKAALIMLRHFEGRDLNVREDVNRK